MEIELKVSFNLITLGDNDLNQLVVRVFDLNENITESKLLPKHEYNLDKVTKYFQVDSSNIRLQ